MRYLGLDLGTRTLGLAISDELGMIATSYKILHHHEDYDSLIPQIMEEIKEKNVKELVLGFPKNMNNTEGERCEKTLEFQGMLEKRCGLPVVLWDERLTTVAADRSLEEGGVPRKERKAHLDRIAAVLILQGYLDSLAFQAEQG